ncbi:MAG TPA: hypothetical protein VLA06_08440 [Woeseiaceae bacterium]|jgi:hypothetical protein|nr:hypothetical protein [Woeseiaceae bacterium]
MGTAWKAMALALITLLSTDARALDRPEDRDIYEDDGYSYPGWLCTACRDPADYPADFAAFAYNAYWGSDNWAFSSRLGIPFRVYNLEGQWVVVWFEDLFFDLPSLLPNTMEIRIRLETGEIITITVVQGGPDLPVGDDTAAEPAGCECDGEESEDAEDGIDDDFVDEYYGWDEWEPEGYVEIIDPDENGDFPEWIEEL